MYEKLSKEQIELILTEHYINARDFCWHGYDVQVTHEGVKAQLDIKNMMYENSQLKRNVDYVQGGRDTAMQIVSAAFGGSRMSDNGGNVMTVDEFMEKYDKGASGSDTEEQLPPVQPDVEV